MKTLFSIGVLIVFGVVANFVTVFVLNIAGLPGALIGGRPQKRNQGQFILGLVVSAIGQSYVYLAYTAFVVNWTMLAISNRGVNFLIWPIAFLAVIVPIWINLIQANLETKESGIANVQTEALYITVLIALIGFFVLAFVPKIMEIVYGWVPYVHP